MYERNGKNTQRGMRRLVDLALGVSAEPTRDKRNRSPVFRGIYLHLRDVRGNVVFAVRKGIAYRIEKGRYLYALLSERGRKTRATHGEIYLRRAKKRSVRFQRRNVERKTNFLRRQREVGNGKADRGKTITDRV